MSKLKWLKLPAILLSLFGCISDNNISKAPGDYHFLSDNLVDSENYEIIKLINGPIDGVLYVPEINMILVQAGSYFWKINDKGYVIDTLERTGGMFSSGLILKEDFFIDWVYTGNKSKQPYSNIIDASAMTKEQLKTYFDDTEIIEFERKYRDGIEVARAYLKKKDSITVLDISKYFDLIDTQCDRTGYVEGNFHKLYWDDTCLEWYEKKYKDKIIFLENTLEYSHNWEDKNQSFFMQKFSKKTYHFEEGFFGWAFGNIMGRTLWAELPGKRPGTYWSGMGYFQLRHNSENLYFKSLITNEDDQINFENISILNFPEKNESYTSFINLEYRAYNELDVEQKLNKYYEKDVGLFAIRRKVNLKSDKGRDYKFDTEGTNLTLDLENTTLENKFTNALSDTIFLQDFINISKEIAANSPFVKDYAFQFANYTTKLLIKNITDGNFVEAKKVLLNYIKNLLPYSGSDNKTSDVASNGLVLGILSKDESLNKIIFNKLLGSDFKIDSIENEILLFNLASYYALHSKKELLLQATVQALKKGKSSTQFLTDVDFKFYWNDEDFINVLNNSIVRKSDNTEPLKSKFELDIKLSGGQEIRFDTRYWNPGILNENIPIYELLYPENVTLSLIGMKGNTGTALVSQVGINNVSDFLFSLLESTRISVDSEKIIPTINESFSFGITRLSEKKVILFNAKHITDHSTGIYDHSFVIDHESFTKEVQKFISIYNNLQKKLKEHIDHYLYDPLYTQELDGLSIALLNKRLRSLQEEQNFDISIKNVSDKTISLIDNINISTDPGIILNISIQNNPAEDSGLIELKPNESIILQTEEEISFINNIHLNVSMVNTFPMMTNMLQKNRLDAMADNRFSHTWTGHIDSDIAVFTLADTWQNDVGTKDKFDIWIAKFKPDFID